MFGCCLVHTNSFIWECVPVGADIPHHDLFRGSRRLAVRIARPDKGLIQGLKTGADGIWHECKRGQTGVPWYLSCCCCLKLSTKVFCNKSSLEGVSEHGLQLMATPRQHRQKATNMEYASRGNRAPGGSRHPYGNDPGYHTTPH